MKKYLKNTYIIDGSFMLHRALHLPDVFALTNSKGDHTGGIFQFLRMLNREVKSCGDYFPVVVFDQGLCKRRTDLDPNYKNATERARQDEMVLTPEEVENDYVTQYRKQRDRLSVILPQFGIPVIKLAGWEGDDLMYILSKISERSIVLTDDRDMLQLLSDTCDVKRPKANEYVTLESFLKTEGYQNTHDFVSCKALQGDGCLTGDTKISLLTGEEKRIDELLDLKEFWVYSYDVFAKKVVPSKGRCARKTKVVDKICLVTLDNEEIIKCTENHLFLLKSGKYVRAEDLKPGDSLQAVYRSVNDKGYEVCYLDNQDCWISTHKLVYTELHNDYSIPLKEGCRNVIHHKDFNKKNNSPENLELMSWFEHTSYHNLIAKTGSKVFKKMWKDNYEEMRKRSSENMKKAHLDYPDKMIKGLLKYNKDPKRIEKLRNKKLKESVLGIHPWQKEENINKLKEINSKVQKSLVANGNHISQTERGKKISSDNFKKANKKMLELGVHTSQNYKDEYKIKQNKTRIVNLKRLIEDNGLDVYDWDNSLQKLVDVGLLRSQSRMKYTVAFNSIDELLLYEKTFNHRVVKIDFEYLEEEIPVYDITVDKYSNFLLSSGVIVHNSDNIPGACKGVGEGNTKGLWVLYKYCLENNVDYPKTEKEVRDICKEIGVKYRSAYLNLDFERYNINLQLVDLNFVRVSPNVLDSIVATVMNSESSISYFNAVRQLSELEITDFSLDELMRSVKLKEPYKKVGE